MAESVEVRNALGDNIGRIRRLRGMTVRDLSARLKELGLKLSASSVSEIENAGRKVSVDELLTMAIALNTSTIDLLMPADGSSLTVAEGVEPVDPRSIEQWLQGETVWPPVWLEGGERVLAQINEHLAAASEYRQRMHRQDLRSELQAIDWLRELTRVALDALEDAKAPRMSFDLEGVKAVSPRRMAEKLRAALEEVVNYETLLANRLDKKETWSRDR